MKYFLPIPAILIFLSSCGMHIEKRHYRDGFYISTNQNRTDHRGKDAEETSSFESALQSYSQDPTVCQSDQAVPVIQDQSDSGLNNAAPAVQNFELPAIHAPEPFHKPAPGHGRRRKAQ